MKRFIMVLLLVFSIIPCAALAAEVRNIQVGQEGGNAVATYDLVATAGERGAEVTVTIIINGQRRTADQMRLSGDFGKNVKVGTGKRIIWNATADLPPNFEGELSWDVTTVEKSYRAATDSGLEGIADEMVLPARNGDVRFNHRLHAEILRDCGGCHENGPGRIGNFGKDFAHKTCKGCHVEKNSGPTKCGECHKR